MAFQIFLHYLIYMYVSRETANTSSSSHVLSISVDVYLYPSTFDKAGDEKLKLLKTSSYIFLYIHAIQVLLHFER